MSENDVKSERSVYCDKAKTQVTVICVDSGLNYDIHKVLCPYLQRGFLGGASCEHGGACGIQKRL